METSSRNPAATAATTRSRRHLAILMLGLTIVLPQTSFARQVDEAPSPLEMMTDVAIARPLGLVMTVVGTAAFVVTLPFSAAGGNMKEAADTLVIGPAKETFVRCLGCQRAGRREKIAKQN